MKLEVLCWIGERPVNVGTLPVVGNVVDLQMEPDKAVRFSIEVLDGNPSVRVSVGKSSEIIDRVAEPPKALPSSLLTQTVARNLNITESLICQLAPLDTKILSFLLLNTTKQANVESLAAHLSGALTKVSPEIVENCLQKMANNFVAWGYPNVLTIGPNGDFEINKK